MAGKAKSALRGFDRAKRDVGALSEMSSDGALMSDFAEDASGRFSPERAARLLSGVESADAEAGWTVDKVRERLLEAARGCERLAGRVGPARMKGFWPEIDSFRNMTPADEMERELAVIAGTRPPERSSRPLDPRRIARIEEAIEWPGRYLGSDAHALNRKALQTWLWCDVRNQKFGWACGAVLRCGRASGYRRIDAALRVILEGVIRDGVRQ
jgi:hypothetical protein